MNNLLFEISKLQRQLHEICIGQVRRAEDGPGAILLKEVKNNTNILMINNVKRIIQSERKTR